MEVIFGESCDLGSELINWVNFDDLKAFSIQLQAIALLVTIQVR